MRTRIKIGLGFAAAFVVFVAWVFLELTLPSNTLLHTFKIDSRTTIKISMTDGSDPETFTCVFEVSTNGRVAIPRAMFDGGMRSGSSSDSHWYARDTRYTMLVGPRSRIAGIASVDDPEIILLAIDLDSLEFFNSSDWEANRAKGQALVARLANDFPDKKIALAGSETARLMGWRKYHGDEPPPTPDGRFTN